ncbi:MAG: hypothetical protein FJ220_01570 [Kiritimatiellaceae bacterium]|nr:hypothetical protein [Kiritimatiellaceae bacterium]
MIILDHGIPVRFHSLDLFHQFDDESVIQEIVEEVSYTLLSVEAEYGHLPLHRILLWNQSEMPERMFEILGKHCQTEVQHIDLSTLPSFFQYHHHGNCVFLADGGIQLFSSGGTEI